MVSPLTLFSSAISSPRMAACSKYPAVAFGNAAPTEMPNTYIPGSIVNHNTQPFFNAHPQALGPTGMYFRGSIVGSRLNLLG